MIKRILSRELAALVIVSVESLVVPHPIIVGRVVAFFDHHREAGGQKTLDRLQVATHAQHHFQVGLLLDEGLHLGWLTFLSYSPGRRKRRRIALVAHPAPNRRAPSTRLAGPQLLKLWYSCSDAAQRYLLRDGGRGGGRYVGEGEGVIVAARLGRSSCAGWRLQWLVWQWMKASWRSATWLWTMASTCSWGTKTTSSGGLRARQAWTRRLASRGDNLS